MKTNKYLEMLVIELRKHSNKEGAKIWKRVASDLEKPTSRRRIVNLAKIQRFTKENETIVVPGKVLGAGDIDHTVNVAAFNFSSQAKEKIQKANGKALSILDLVKINPKGKQVRIIG